MHIGILGGTFNPIHNCHLQIAQQVQTRLGLHRIVFIPTGDPPHKANLSLAPAQHRLAMVKTALKSYHAFQVSDIEVRASRTSFTVDTITSIQHEQPVGHELFFIVGLDAFLEFPSWKQASHLLGMCHFVVCSRPGTTFRALSSMPLIPSLPTPELEKLDDGRIDREDFALSSATNLTLLALPPCEISASTIRYALNQGLSISHWLPPSVESYIIDHKLYQCPSQ